MIRWRMGWVLALVAASPLAGQERWVEEVDLPRAVADRVVEFFNRPGTVRFRGAAEVPPDAVLRGDVAVLEGPMTVAGLLEGELVVVNGDLEILPGGRVTGDVTVVGGVVTGDSTAVGGQLTVYGESLAYRRSGDRITRDRRRPWRDESDGDAWISVRSAGNYNRVEGLPLFVGPVFRTRTEREFRADALAIWRSEGGLRVDTERMGYLLRARQAFGPGGRLSAGATVHSRIVPIEDGGLTETEASLATLLLRRDYRDYYEQEGFSGFLRFQDEDSGVRLTAEYRDEDHAFVPAADPWTLSGDEAWRPQPLVGEGRLRTLGGEFLLDRRNDPDDPSDGWYLTASLTRGIEGTLEIPATVAAEPLPPDAAGAARTLDAGFTAGSLDLRRFVRLGPATALRLRGFVAGSADGSPLPPQFQRALGGEGSLPGYPLFGVDCGARSRAVGVVRGADAPRVPAFAGYGCDRVALFQAEYRGSVSFDWDPGDEEWDEGWGWSPDVSINPSWSVFFDAGRGWSLAEDGSPARLGPDTDTLMDVGVGFFLGDLGLYWAWPLQGENRMANFFVRLSHRF